MFRTPIVLGCLVAFASAQTPMDVDLLGNGSGDSPAASLQGSDNGQDFYTLPGWTQTSGTWMAQEGAWFGIDAFAGTRFIRTHQDASNRMTQGVPIDLPAGGPHTLTLRAAIRNWDTTSDEPEMSLELYSGASLVASETTGPILNDTWQEYAIVREVPAGVTTAVVVLEGTRTSGGYNDSYFDDVQLILTEGTPLVPMFDVEVDTQSWPPVVTFTDTTAGAVTSRSWEFGDGEFDVGDEVVHQYPGPGTYDVTLTVTSPGRIDQITREGGVVITDPGAIEIIKGPYLQHATQDAMTVMWETNVPGSSILHYFDDGVWKQAMVEDPTLIHEVRVDGFSPDQEVPYVVETMAAGSSIMSDEATFTTAPPFGAPVRFALWGDNQDRPEVFSQLVAHMIDDEPDLLVAMGDLVATGSVYEHWNSRLFAPLRPLIRTTPMISSIGNHELDWHWFYEFLAQPGNEHWFGYSYSNTHWVVIDTNYPFTPGSEQYEFIREELFSDEARNATWLFTNHHHPPFSELWDEPIQQQIRTHLLPLYEQAGVDIMFHGHIHSYERGVFEPTSTNRRLGTIQTSGAGGTLWDDDYEPDWPQIDLVIQYTYHYCVMDIDGENLSLRAVDIDGNEMDMIDFVAEPKPDLDPPDPGDTDTQWDFEGGDLAPTYGPGTMEFIGPTGSMTTFGTTTSLGLPPIGGAESGVMGFPKATTNAIGSRVRHATTANGGGSYVNDYTIIFDLLIPQSSFAQDDWLGIHNTNASNTNDADAFIRLSDGAIGILGTYGGQILPDTWHRVALTFGTVNGSDIELVTFIDGQEVGRQIVDSTDGRFSLYTSSDATPWFHLFTDDSGDATSGYVSSLYYADRTLSPTDIANIGAPDADGILADDTCPPDLTEDGTLDIFDVLEYLARFDAADPDADLNADTVIDIFDVLEYLEMFDEGC